jgi:L-aspartate oxidase
VALVSKRTLEDSASSWAQGGIAAVLDNRDSIEAHIRDTITAGAFLNDRARHALRDRERSARCRLADSNRACLLRVTKDGYHLAREGGHSARRVIHVADATGQAVQTTTDQPDSPASEHQHARTTHRHRPDHR